ncbi:MAG: DUF6111 family protein [Hyphomicrobiales bacterium]|jgi:hypothetical protein|nr:DUF6111 family protein [Hyphomicrobiales bacterium]
MIRPVLTEVGIFLIPFVLYALFLLATAKGVTESASWPARVVLKLLIAAFLSVIISFVLLAHFSGAAPTSTYTPAHLEDGKLVPGQNR